MRGCPLIEYGPPGNPYQLEFWLDTPARCPVPLGTIGEVKWIAGYVYDYGTYDFDYAVAMVLNNDRVFMGSARSRFRRELNRQAAFPRMFYEAAPGFPRNPQSPQPDRGYFVATNRLVGVHPGDPYGEIYITYRTSPLVASVDGPTIPPAHQTHTWRAGVTGGVEPFTYGWYRDGVWQGSGSSYTGDTGAEPFVLRVDVTDQTMSTRSAIFGVDVGGLEASIGGPSAAYGSYSGVWYASAIGGSGSYTFDWYVDGSWVRRGSVWDGYMAQGFRQLVLRATDSNERTHQAEMNVMVFPDCQSPEVACPVSGSEHR